MRLPLAVAIACSPSSSSIPFPAAARRGLALLAVWATAACAQHAYPLDRDEGPGRVPRKPAAAPASLGMHRLSNFEYDNTVQDLLGTTLRPASLFLKEEALGFDNIAAALGMTEVQYEAYFNAAEALAQDAFSRAEQRAQLTACPGAADDEACAAVAIRTFGAQAWRRPLSPPQVEGLLATYREARQRGEDFTRAMQTVVTAMLVAPEFLYRIDHQPVCSSEPQPLDGYELASRLSYALWSSMPDARLFALAATGELQQVDTLLQEVDRLLADAKAARFIDSFAGQWLGMDALQTHQVSTAVFPTWSEELRQAMLAEMRAFVGDEFLRGDRPWSELLTADVSFVDEGLAAHYGMSGLSGLSRGRPTRVEVTSDARRGFLGLGGFLTLSSGFNRSKPTERARQVLSNLLCSPPPDPPPNLPPLEVPAGTEHLQNIRARLEQHRADPQCASCHALLDPIGLGMEQFDGVGAFRERYGNGDPVDATGVMPDGAAFDGLVQLSEVLSRDPRLLSCAVQKAYIYLLGRDVAATDGPVLSQIETSCWPAEGMTLRGLIKCVVASEAFRARTAAEP